MRGMRRQGAHLVPYEPFAADADWGLLVATVSPYTSWHEPAGGDDGQTGDTPIMEYMYTDGYSTGVGYMEVWSESPMTISGTSGVRETFTVTSKDRNVPTVSVWLRRLSGSGPLTIRLETAAGAVLEQGTIPAASIPTTYAWSTYTFQSTQSLAIWQSYNLTLSAPAGSSYDAYAICNGSGYFSANARFADGYAQFNTGSGWVGWEAGGTSNRTNADLMFYFTTDGK